MAQSITITPTRTYSTPENARRAVDKKITNPDLAHLRYMVMQHTDGRYFPLFIGTEAVQAGVHFHFNIVA